MNQPLNGLRRRESFDRGQSEQAMHDESNLLSCIISDAPASWLGTPGRSERLIDSSMLETPHS